MEISKQLGKLRIDRIIEVDTLTRFKLEKQIQRVEDELQTIELQLKNSVR